MKTSSRLRLLSASAAIAAPVGATAWPRENRLRVKETVPMTLGKHSRAALVALAAVAATATGGGSASAAGYTRVGDTNEFLESGAGRISFSLSLAPVASQEGMVSVGAVPNVGVDNSSAGNVQAGSNGFAFAGSGSSATDFGGAFAGSSPTAKAPVTGAGTPFSGRYLAGSGGGYTYISDPNKIGYRAMTLLWGSVEAENYLAVMYGSTAGGTVHLYGSDILAAAASMGIPDGNAGSFYVTINERAASSGPGMDLVGAFSSNGGPSFEWVPLAFSSSSISVPVPLTASSGGGAGSPSEAPAPVLGATPAGGLLGLGLLGFLGLGRARRGAPAAA